MTPWDEAAPNKTQLDLVLQRKKKGNCWRCPHVICIDWYLMCFQQLCKLTQYVKLGTSQLSLFQEQRKRLICWDKNFILWGELVFFIYKMSLPEVCKSICSAQASCVVPYSIFFGHMNCVFSLSSRGVACPYTYWLTLPLGAFGNQPMVAGSLTGAELRLMTHSQMYRAPCWTAAKWLCLFLWSNSLLSLMLTVVVGYWSLAWLLLW